MEHHWQQAPRHPRRPSDGDVLAMSNHEERSPECPADHFTNDTGRAGATGDDDVNGILVMYRQGAPDHQRRRSTVDTAHDRFDAQPLELIRWTVGVPYKHA